MTLALNNYTIHPAMQSKSKKSGGGITAAHSTQAKHFKKQNAIHNVLQLSVRISLWPPKCTNMRGEATNLK
jgi:hypothetical protein